MFRRHLSSARLRPAPRLRSAVGCRLPGRVRSTGAFRSAVVLLAVYLLMVAPPIGPPSGAVAAVRLAPQRAPEPALRFRWPLDGQPSVVRPFDPPPRPWLAGHRGVDLAVEPGSPVRAAGGGVVRFAGPVAGRGVVSVDHPGGLRTTYEPVTPTVRAGDRVVAGDLLGSLVAGHPGCAVAACLHWGLRRGTEYLDPLALLGRAPVRLLPLDAPARPARRGGEGSRATGPRRGHARGWAWRYAARSRSRETCV